MRLMHWSLAIGKRGLMRVHSVLSQISLCSPHWLIRDDTFYLTGFFSKQRLFSNKTFEKVLSILSQYSLHRLIWDDTLLT